MNLTKPETGFVVGFSMSAFALVIAGTLGATAFYHAALILLLPWAIPAPWSVGLVLG